jgi:flagellar biosynthetic protein FliR
MPAVFDATFLVVTVLLTLRLSVIAALLPLISGRTVPVVWRLTLCGVVAAAAAPVVAETLPPGGLVLTWETLLLEAGNSVVVGMMVAFVMGIPFAAVRFAGQIIGVQIGFSMVNTIDPQSGIQASVLAQFYYLLAVILFFAMDLHHLLIRVLVETCYVVPLFGEVAGRAGAWQVVSTFGEFFKMGFVIATPVVIVLLLISAAMGFVVKTVPQINILIVGFPIKIAVGLAAMGASLVFFGRIVTGLMEGMEADLYELLAALRA